MSNVTLRVKSAIVGSRLESVFRWGRRLSTLPRRFRSPELSELFLEESLVQKVLAKLLTPSANILDVGCHIGSFLSLAMRISPEAQFTAIEASPEKAAWLRKKFPFARILEIAVCDRDGEAVFDEREDAPGFSRLRSELPSQNSKSTVVRTSRIDSLNFIDRFDLIKMDIEGAELAALKGGAEYISKFKPHIIFECGPTEGLVELGVDRDELFNWFIEQGYEVFLFSEFIYKKGPLTLHEFRKCGLYPFRAFNFLAIQKVELPKQL